MLLHTNATCAHNESPLTPIRVLYYKGEHLSALRQLEALEREELTQHESTVATFHQYVCELALGMRDFASVKAYLAAQTELLFKGAAQPNLIAEMRAAEAMITARFDERDSHATLWRLVEFLDDLPDHPTVRTYYVMTLARLTQEDGRMSSAALLYKWATEIVGDDRPCLREMVLRRYALCLRQLSREDEAQSVLRLGGLLPGRLTYEELLVVPEF